MGLHGCGSAGMFADMETMRVTLPIDVVEAAQADAKLNGIKPSAANAVTQFIRRRRCPKCGYRVRGPNHEQGREHKSGGKQRAK